MTLDLTKPVTTRDGRPVRIVEPNLKCSYPILGIITEPNGTEEVRLWSSSGQLIEGHHDRHDLINKPETVRGWLNVYPGIRTGSRTMVLHPTRAVADELATDERVACVEFECTEGFGL